MPVVTYNLALINLHYATLILPCNKPSYLYIFALSNAEMLINLGIPWVILGHSERRLILNESNEVRTGVLVVAHYYHFVDQLSNVGLFVTNVK